MSSISFVIRPWSLGRFDSCRTKADRSKSKYPTKKSDKYWYPELEISTSLWTKQMKEYQFVVKSQNERTIFRSNIVVWQQQLPQRQKKLARRRKWKHFSSQRFCCLYLDCLSVQPKRGMTEVGSSWTLAWEWTTPPVDQKAFLTPLIGLEVSMIEKVIVDVGFSFESHSYDFSGIEKTVDRYFTIHLLGKYFLLGNLWAGTGFAYSMFLNSYTVNAVPATPGAVHPDRIQFLLATGYLSKVLEGIYLNPSLLVRMVLPSEEADSFDFNLGLFITASLNIRRD